MLLRHFCAPGLLFLSLPAAAANLIPNPGFDQPDVSGWVRVVPVSVASGEWNDRDQADSAASGSLRVTAQESSPQLPAQIQICVPVVAGRTYAYGGSALIPSPGKPSQLVGAQVHWWSGANCKDDTFSLYYDGTDRLLSLIDSWGPIQGSSTAPPLAQSASLIFKSAATLITSVEIFIDNVFFIEDETCVTTLNALCLHADRFLVTVEYLTPRGANGYGRAVGMTEDSGYFWFFDPANVEIVAKLIDACSTLFDSFWFFASGLTNVETKIRVRDTTVRDALRTYTNPLEMPFAPIQDTDAFATCP